MKTNIFVNLPVKDLEHSKKFFGAIGYQFNPQFTNDKGACMVIDENIYVMLVTEPFFKQLTERDVADNSKGVECATCLSVESRAAVDEWMKKALAAGAKENVVPEIATNEMMYSRSINDPDGHIWEVLWMDPKAVQK